MNYNPNIVLAYFEQCGLPPAVTEHQFAAAVSYVRKDGREGFRKWAFDFAWLDSKVALEVEGLFGRHQRIGGFLADMKKYNTAVVLGWRVLRTTTKEVCMEETVEMIRKAMTYDQRTREASGRNQEVGDGCARLKIPPRPSRTRGQPLGAADPA